MLLFAGTSHGCLLAPDLLSGGANIRLMAGLLIAAVVFIVIVFLLRRADQMRRPYDEPSSGMLPESPAEGSSVDAQRAHLPPQKTQERPLPNAPQPTTNRSAYTPPTEPQVRSIPENQPLSQGPIDVRPSGQKPAARVMDPNDDTRPEVARSRRPPAHSVQPTTPPSPELAKPPATKSTPLRTNVEEPETGSPQPRSGGSPSTSAKETALQTMARTTAALPVQHPTKPKERPVTTSAPATQQLNQSPTKTASPASTGDRKRILVIEDSSTMRRIFAMALHGEPYELTVVEQGSQAQAKAEETQPHLILADVSLDDMDGYQICLSLRDHPQLQNTKMVLMASKQDDDAESRCAEVGAIGVLVKPFSSQELLDLIAKHTS